METEAVRGLSVQSSFQLKLPPHLILPSSNIKLVEPIGQGKVLHNHDVLHVVTITCPALHLGEFGIVYKGYITRNRGEVVSDVVAIKTLKGIHV